MGFSCGCPILDREVRILRTALPSETQAFVGPFLRLAGRDWMLFWFRVFSSSRKAPGRISRKSSYNCLPQRYKKSAAVLLSRQRTISLAIHMSTLYGFSRPRVRAPSSVYASDKLGLSSTSIVSLCRLTSPLQRLA